MEELGGRRSEAGVVPQSPTRGSCLLPQRVVKFASQESIAIIENWPSPAKSVDMAQQLYETFPSDQVTDEMVAGAAKMFSENYGIWGHRSARPGKHH